MWPGATVLPLLPVLPILPVLPVLDSQLVIAVKNSSVHRRLANSSPAAWRMH